jgi:hypothetical protein
MKKTTVLMILDGFGISEKFEGNAIAEAKTPNIDEIIKKYPCKRGYASGLDVGLPDGQMGNSEVGHLNIGAGRIVYQEYTRISKDIEDGGFFENEAMLKAIKNAKANIGKAGFSYEERGKMTELLESGFLDSFRELHPEEIKYSWWSYRFRARENNAGWRLDYFLISKELLPKVREAEILNDIMGSDHCPVLVDIDI